VPPGVKSVAVVAVASCFDTAAQSASSAQRALLKQAKKNNIAANRKRNGMWKGMMRDSKSRVALSDTGACGDSRHWICVQTKLSTDDFAVSSSPSRRSVGRGDQRANTIPTQPSP